MAGRGPTPKPPGTRSRTNRTRPDRQVAADDALRGFDLPDGYLPGGEAWHPATRAWWAVWRRAPQAQAMGDTDWQELLATALMHHVMWQRGRWEFASEIRLRVSKFGATVEDRLRLRMEITEPAPADPPLSLVVTEIRSRRKRLTEPPGA